MKISYYSDVMKYINKYSKNKNSYIFRGMGSYKYKILPSLLVRYWLPYRNGIDGNSEYKIKSLKRLEKYFCVLQKEKGSHKFDYWQHYGAPTLYVDYTYCLLVSIYFAYQSYLERIGIEIIKGLRHSFKSKAFNAKINNNIHEKPAVFIVNLNKLKSFKCVGTNSNHNDSVFHIIKRNDKSNQRMKDQHGLLIGSSNPRSIENYLINNSNENKCVGQEYYFKHNKENIFKKIILSVNPNDILKIFDELNKHKVSTNYLFRDAWEKYRINLAFDFSLYCYYWQFYEHLSGSKGFQSNCFDLDELRNHYNNELTDFI